MKTKRRLVIMPCLLAAFFALTAILAGTSAVYAENLNSHNIVIGREIELKHGQITINWYSGRSDTFSPDDVPPQGVTKQCVDGDVFYVKFWADNGYVLAGRYIYAYSPTLEDGRIKLDDQWNNLKEGDIWAPTDINDPDYYITIDASFKPEAGKREIVVGSRTTLANGKIRIESDTGTLVKEFTQKGDCLANEGAGYRISFIPDAGYELDEKEVVFYSFGDGTDTAADLTYDSENKCYTFTVPNDRPDDYEIAINASFREIPTYAVTVQDGMTSKARAAEGESVTITAYTPLTGKRFAGWTGADSLDFINGSSAASAVATFTMPARAVTVTANYVSDWALLQQEINDAESGATIILTGNLIAAEDDLQLVIPEGKTVTIDMGGYTLDRGLSGGEPKEYDARVFDVYGSLILLNGTLTGGNGKYSDGAVTVYRNGSLDMSGVTVLNNYSKYQTGGVRVGQGASAALTDCVFRGNSSPAFAADNDAVLTVHNCTVASYDPDQDRAEIRIDKDLGPALAFNLSGNLTLQQEDGTAGRLRIEKSSVITITGELTNTEPIPVVLKNNPTGTDVRVFTSGLAGYGTAGNFASAYDGCLVVLTDDGEAALAVKKTVTFDAGGGTGEMETAVFAAGASCELPGCGFTAPAGKYFKAWSVKIGDANAVTKAAGDPITVSEDTTVTALWISDWGLLQQQINDAESGAAITLTGNLTAAEDDLPLTIPENKTITIDMGGYTLDRGLDADTPKTDGMCMIVGDYSTLTLTNGTLTGGSSVTDGGAIYRGAYSTLNMSDVTVRDNQGDSGGAVYMDWGGYLNLTGCTFSGNSARYRGGAIYVSFYSTLTVKDCVFCENSTRDDDGGAIYGLYTDDFSYPGEVVFPGATIRISGNLEIDGESFSAGSNNLFLGKNGIVIEVTDTLTNTKPIPVSVQDNPSGTNVRVITNGLAGNGTYQNFVSVNSNYTVVPTDGGEAALAVKSRVHNVILNDNYEHGSVAADKEYVVEGDTVTLTLIPEAYYEAAAVTVAKASGGEVMVTDGRFVMPAEDVSVTVVFAPIEYNVSIRGGGGSVTSDKDKAIKGETVTLTVVPDDDRYLDPQEMKVKIKDKNEYVPLVKIDETTYSFIMPGDDIESVLQFYPYPQYNIQIGGVWLTTKRISGDGWSYEGDADGGTLTLNNANITLGNTNNANIFLGIPVTIVLEGENELSGQQKGIYAQAPLTVKGEGKLSAQGRQFGIQTLQGLTISDKADITADGGTIGLQTAGALNITDSTVHAAGEVVGIYAIDSNITISGSEVTASASTYTGVKAVDIVISNNSTAAFSGDHVGIDCASAVITDSNVTAAGTQDIGLNASGSVTFNGGTTDAAGGVSAVAANAIILGEGMYIKTPALGSVSADGKTIVESDGTTEAAHAVIAEAVPKFKSCQLILSGQIGMQFYMTIPEGITDGTMTFTVGERTAEAEGAVQSDGRVLFTCSVNSVEMAEPIAAAYTYTVNGEEKTVTCAACVKEYLETIIENTGGAAAYTAATPLAKAIYNYGHYAMRAVPDGSNHPDMPNTYTTDLPLIDSLEGYAITASLDPSVITSAGYSLSLDSETAVNFNLRTETELTKDENVFVTAPSGTMFEYTVEKTGFGWRVRITGIGAHELGTQFTLTTGETTISASAMSYVEQCLANDASEETKHAAAALYEYYRQAIGYRSGLNNP